MCIVNSGPMNVLSQIMLALILAIADVINLLLVNVGVRSETVA
jgi:hypothetical protein